MRRVLPLLLLCACVRDGRLGTSGRDGGSCSVARQDEGALLSCTDGSTGMVHHGELGGAGGQGPQGPPGQDGDPAPPSERLRLVQHAACPGGVHVETWVDTDDDGELGGGEVVQGSWRICPPAPTCSTLESSLLFRSSWDMAEFEGAGCTEVNGDVNVHVPGLPDLSALRNLQRVSGTLTIAQTGVKDLDDLAQLREVGRLQLLDNPELESVAGLAGLTRARFVDLSGLPKLRSLQGLEGLTTTEDLTLDGSGVTDLVPLAGLKVTPGSVSFASNPSLLSIDLPVTAGSLSSVVVTDNRALVSIAGLRPSLVTGALIVSRNRALPTCEAQSLLDALRTEPGFVEIAANDDAGVCP